MDGPLFGTEMLTAILAYWKEMNYNNKWSGKNDAQKIESLKELIDVMCPADRCIGNQYCYDPINRRITLDYHNPSILSTLHEIGHCLYGESELKACKFSVWLFKDVFPKAFQKLKWDDHMLKQSNA